MISGVPDRASDRTIPFGEPITIEAVELRAVRMPLLEPFETSFGRIDSRLALLTRVEAGGHVGWGEAVAFEAPMFTAETAATVRHVVTQFLAPALMASPVSSLSDVSAAFDWVRGHQMAKAGLELA